MNTSYSLSTYRRPKRVRFDAKNDSHLKIAARFLRTNSWGVGCPFLLEHPYVDIRSMILVMVTETALKIKKK